MPKEYKPKGDKKNGIADMNIKIITKLAFPEIIKYNIIPIPLISKIGNLNNQCLKVTLFHLIKFSFTLMYFFLIKNIKIKSPKWAPNKEVIDKLYEKYKPKNQTNFGIGIIGEWIYEKYNSKENRRVWL